MTTPEGTIKFKIREYLKALVPSVFFFSPMMNGYGVRGVPDIVGVYKGRFFGIEVKVPGKEPTVWQDECLHHITMAGGLVIVAHSLDEVKVAFEPFRDDPR